MKENNKNEESGDSGTLCTLAQPPDIPTIAPVCGEGHSRDQGMDSDMPKGSINLIKTHVSNCYNSAESAWNCIKFSNIIFNMYIYKC